jgi:hypothetical protein
MSCSTLGERWFMKHGIRRRRNSAALLALALVVAGGASPALAAEAGPPPAPSASPSDASGPPAPSVSPAAPSLGDAIAAYFANWDERVRIARATQPTWSSPVLTTTALLEERFRFDLALDERAANGATTTIIDGGKGLDLIVGPSTEIQVAADPYQIRTTPNGKGQFSGFADWPFFRIKERLASSPEDAGNYVVSTWLQVQAPTGIQQLTNHAWTLLPTVGYGKGFDRFVFQGTFQAVIPTSHETTLGIQVVSNLALQYHLLQYCWPQIEVSWTRFVDGPKNGKDQVFLVPGLVLGRFSLTDRFKLTVGAGYEFAVEPHFQPSPLLPTFNHAWLVTTRLSF